MEKGNTKERILEVSLDLFSIRGYETTSISQIADPFANTAHALGLDMIYLDFEKRDKSEKMHEVINNNMLKRKNLGRRFFYYI